jgi:hypothetical protein
VLTVSARPIEHDLTQYPIIDKLNTLRLRRMVLRPIQTPPTVIQHLNRADVFLQTPNATTALAFENFTDVKWVKAERAMFAEGVRRNIT